MNVRLMHPDRDFDAAGDPPPHAQELAQDLELDLIWDTMAAGDPFLRDMARRALLAASVGSEAVILHRQAVLRDCLAHPDAVRELYGLAVEAIASEKRIHFGLMSKSPDTVLRRSAEVLNVFMGQLARLQRFARRQRAGFHSLGFTALLALIEHELSDDYLVDVQRVLKELAFSDGVLFSANLGQGGKGANYTLRRRIEERSGLAGRFWGQRPPVYSFTIAERDQRGARALWEIKEGAINHAANALAQSVDHILNFFAALRSELAFYVGCLNLHARLAALGLPACLPLPAAPAERRHACRGLYDVALALLAAGPVVANNLAADGKTVVVITGANQGGKSTFLRSVGQAQLMLQAGMFAGAEALEANVCPGLFTHFPREEDAALQSGKLDEELRRISAIVDHITPDSLLLCNESFAATNEREGSEIARQVVLALAEQRIKLFYVTHLADFARSLYDRGLDNVLFLRAGREESGERTYKLEVGEPLATSFGADLYARIFGAC